MLFRKDSSLTVADDREPWSAEWYPVSADYFETVKIPLVRGRVHAPGRTSDAPGGHHQRHARGAYWPNENPVGRMLQTDVLDDPPREIVGVVGDVRQDRYQSAPVPQRTRYARSCHTEWTCR